MADLAALAADAGRLLSQSELHGAVCGLAAGGAGPAAQQGGLVRDLVQLVGSDALADAQSLDAFVEASVADFFAQDMGFQPLLPDDAAPISARVQAIAEWCGAFAAGYAAAAVPETGHAQATGKRGAQNGRLAPADERPAVAAGHTTAAQQACPADEAADAAQRAELLRDFVSISGVELDGEDGEEAEAALLELQEYAKVGALLLASGAQQAEGHGRD